MPDASPGHWRSFTQVGPTGAPLDDNGSLPVNIGSKYNQANLTVPAGSNLSSAVDILRYTSFGLRVGPDFDGTQITFEVSWDNANWVPLYTNANTLITFTVAPNRGYPLPVEMEGWGYFRINCVTAQAGNSTVFTLSMKG